MPHVAVHIDLAGHVLREWDAHPGSAPVDPRAPGVRNAFMAGSIAPDAGFNPGADRLISELAHRVRTVRWPAAVLHRATSDAERAFAWGWLAHVLTDATLHPDVNRAAAEMLGRQEVRADAAQRWGHARAELALDIRAHARNPELARARLRPVFDRAAAPRLQAAFEEVYGPGLTGRAFIRAYRITALTQGAQLFAGRLHARAGRGVTIADRAAGAAVGIVSGIGRRVLPVRHVVRAYVDRDPPPSWLIRRFDAFPDELIERLARAVAAGGIATVPDLDLGTGQILDERRPRRLALITLEKLASRNGGQPLPGLRAA